MAPISSLRSVQGMVSSSLPAARLDITPVRSWIGRTMPLRASKRAEQHTRDDAGEGSGQKHDLRGRRARDGDRRGRLRKRFGRMGGVELERGGDGLLAFQRLVERGEHRRRDPGPVGEPATATMARISSK
jgi:hypothetical protein